MKKIKKNRDYKTFIDFIFERAENPLKELQKIFDIHPIFFMNDECVEYINGKLDQRGYTLNDECINEVKNVFFSCSYGRTSSSPSYGPCNSGGGAWSGCSHVTRGGSSYGGGGCSFGGGGGWCASADFTKNRLVLVKKDKKMIYGGNIN